MTVPVTTKPRARRGLRPCYALGGPYDEMFAAAGEPHPHYRGLHNHLLSLNPAQFAEIQTAADLSFLH